MATKKPRFSITVSDWMFQALEDYRYEAKLSSRSQAALVLIEKGFESVGYIEPNTLAANADNLPANKRKDTVNKTAHRVMSKYWGKKDDTI